MGVEVEGNTIELLYIGYLIKNIRRVTFRLKGLTAIALIRSIKLPNRQALLAINNSNDFLNFSLLPRLYHMGKMDLKLQFILDLQSYQLRHDKVLLNSFTSNFRVTCVYQYHFMIMAAKSLRNLFL